MASSGVTRESLRGIHRWDENSRRLLKSPPSLDQNEAVIRHEVAQKSHFFVPSFRKKRLRAAESNDQQALPQHFPPPPRVDLAVATSQKGGSLDEKNEKEGQREAVYLRRRHRNACFGLALVETMPPEELPPDRVDLILPPIDHAAAKLHDKVLAKEEATPKRELVKELSRKFGLGSKNYKSAQKIGGLVAKLQADAEMRNNFRAELARRKRAARPRFRSKDRGLEHNRLVETLNLHTPRLALEQIEARKLRNKAHAKDVLPNPNPKPVRKAHAREVLRRAETHREMKIGRSAEEAEAKRAKLETFLFKRLHEREYRRVQRAMLVVAFGSRTQRLGELLLRSRHNRVWEVRRLWAAVVLQRQMRKFIAQRVQEKINNAARTIVRYIRKYQVRKIERNFIYAANAILWFVGQRNKGADKKAQIRKVLAAVP